MSDTPCTHHNDQQRTECPVRLVTALTALTAERDQLRAEVERWKTCGIAELAAVNSSVLEYCKHWEARAERAEAEQLDALVADMTRVQTKRAEDAVRVLREIANEDYRGNRSSAAQKAHSFLRSFA